MRSDRRMGDAAIAAVSVLALGCAVLLLADGSADDAPPQPSAAQAALPDGPGAGARAAGTAARALPLPRPTASASPPSVSTRR